MAHLDVKELFTAMLGAAKIVLIKHWKDAAPYAEKEMKGFGENLVMIGKLKAEGLITIEQARIHLSIQKNSSRIVLCTIEGLGILAVENALNAAIDVVRGKVNTAIGWQLL